MSGHMKVDFVALEELRGQINSSAQKILTEIEDCKRTALGTREYWTGAAQEQFGGRYQQLETAQRNVQDAITQFAQLIGGANRAYGEAEDKIRGMFAN